MFVIRVSFPRLRSPAYPDEPTGEVEAVLGAWRMNGQVCGREWPIAQGDGGYVTHVLCPEEESLAAEFNSVHVTAAIAKCEREGQRLSWQSLGEDCEAGPACTCPSPSAYVLFTHFCSLASPVACLDCFRQVALYRFKPLRSGDFHELMCWQSDYQSCDSLQMNCVVLERAATRQLSSVDSQLTKAGRELCATLSASSGRPFYYYLYRGSGRSQRAELARLCPGCGGEWRLASSLHSNFDFKCDRCHLLSNVAFNQRA